MPLIFRLHGTKEHNERETRLSTQETSYHNTNNTRSIVPLPQSSFQLSQSVRQLFRLALSAAGKKQKNRDHPYFLYDTYTSKQCDYIHIAPAWRWWRGGFKVVGCGWCVELKNTKAVLDLVFLSFAFGCGALLAHRSPSPNDLTRYPVRPARVAIFTRVLLHVGTTHVYVKCRRRILLFIYVSYRPSYPL
jgi:hypothetical protein